MRPTRGKRKRNQHERKKIFETLWRLGLRNTWHAAILRADSYSYAVHLIDAHENGDRHHRYKAACGSRGTVHTPEVGDIEPFNIGDTAIGRQYGIGGLCKQCISVVVLRNS